MSVQATSEQWVAICKALGMISMAGCPATEAEEQSKPSCVPQTQLVAMVYDETRVVEFDFPEMPSFDEVSDCCSDDFTFEWPDVSSAMKAIEDGDDDDDLALVSRALSRPPLSHRHNGIKNEACGQLKAGKKKKKQSGVRKKVMKKNSRKTHITQAPTLSPRVKVVEAKAKAKATKKGVKVADAQKGLQVVHRCVRMS